MKLLNQFELSKGKLSISQQIWDTGKEIVKENHVTCDHGEYTEELEPSDPRHKEMIIALHNHKITTNNQ